MDFKKTRGGNRDNERSSSRPPGRTSAGDSIDARPGGPPSGPAVDGPRSIHDTKVWQESSAGVKRIWANYVNTLKVSFRTMNRASQEQLITRVCLIVTMGVSALLTMFFYSFLPLYVRVFAVPLMLVGAYYAGTKLVAPVIIVRYEHLLNREF